MKHVKPQYTTAFRCIASRCRHSCCVGWEIEVDAAAQARYAAVDGPIRERLATHIVDGQFALTPDERCPFLNENGLCDIITELGEAALCQICADHPRFRHFYTDRVEEGLGLCCEEAARLLLSDSNGMSLLVEGEEDATSAETAFFAFRQSLADDLAADDRPLDERLEGWLDAVETPLPTADWYAFYSGLERLDPSWDAYLTALSGGLSPIPAGWETAFANLAIYFLFRHLADAWEEDRLGAGVAFAVLSTRVIATIFASGELTEERLTDIARAYSAEVEYSEENIARLLEKCATFSD
ncbi:MAG: flagellin lysine-N-methylase [Clostridia bacterium]|nr:flagellin lysine-N-methylase [Clostridia bacterium]